MMKIIPLLGALVLVVGCSGGSSEEPTPEPTDPGSPPAAPLPGQPGSTTPPAPGSPPPPAGDPAPTATAKPAGTPASGAFAGAPPYTSTLGPSTIDTSGKGNGHLSFNAAGNPAGKACLTCHDGTGKGGAPAFLFAGTVYEDKAATKPAARIEVRMVGADGEALSSYTDVNGNFFFRQGSGTATVPAVAGVRNATVARSMVNKINDADCNSCHGTTSRITL